MKIAMSRLRAAALVTLMGFATGSAGEAQSLDSHKPAALGAGVNKGNVDSLSGAHYYYFWAGPGHFEVKLAFKEMGIFGTPFRQALNFDFYDDHGKLLSHNAVVSQANLERTSTSGDFGTRRRILLAVIPQNGLVRLGGYYEIEVTGAASFDAPAAAPSGVKPVDTSLYHSGGSLYQPGVSLYRPGQALVVSHNEKETRIVISADVLFNFDEATIRPDAAAALQQAAAILREEHRGVIRIEGHTDSKGSSAYNMRLSNLRAVAVQTWLSRNEGFDISSFSTQGFGATRPAAPNTRPDGSDDPEGRQRNRRVELVINK